MFRVSVLNVGFIGLFSMYLNAGVEAQIKRCESDSLNVREAEGRVVWAYRCDHITINHKNYLLYDEYGGKRNKPLYPTFWDSSDGEVWINAPRSEYASCNKPSYFDRTEYCKAACYTPDQRLLFVDGEVEIFSAYQERKNGLITLSESASLNQLDYEIREVKSYIASFKDTLHEILRFETESGGSIKVTFNHPVLLSDGYMKVAQDIVVGDQLMQKSGNADNIIAIEKKLYYGRVYNLDAVTDTRTTEGRLSQILVAQGYLMGSLYYQNEGEVHLNRMLLRDDIPDDI